MFEIHLRVALQAVPLETDNFISIIIVRSAFLCINVYQKLHTDPILYHTSTAGFVCSLQSWWRYSNLLNLEIFNTMLA